MSKRQAAILVLGVVVIAMPLFFERLHSDEVIYWEIARNVSVGLGLRSETSGNGVFIWHMPLPFYIAAPFLRLSAHIFTARAISAAFTIASAVMVFSIARRDGDEDSAFVGAVLFLLSFQALRFGGRYYLDQYGLFFFLLSLYLADGGRLLWGGVVAVLAAFAREYWIGVYPFLLLYVATGSPIDSHSRLLKKSHLRRCLGVRRCGVQTKYAARLTFSTPGICNFLSNLSVFGVFQRPDRAKTGRARRWKAVLRHDAKRGFLFALPAVAVSIVVLMVVVSNRPIYSVARAYVLDGAAYKNLIAAGGPAYTGRIMRGWAEFAAVNAAAVAGYLASPRRGGRTLFLIIPQVALISLVHGFAVSGGVTQYPLPLVATICLYSGTGLKRLYRAFVSRPHDRYGFIKGALFVSFAQFVVLNVLATAVTLHGNSLVWGLGYSDDRAVISILRSSARGESINGFWGAFVDGRSWDWTDDRIDRAIEKDPDWLVTFNNYVDILPQKNNATQLEIYNIGPYVVIHSLHKGGMKAYVRQKDHPVWAFRKD